MTTYGLIGETLGHSFSKDFFTRKFAREGIDAEYLNFELPDIGDIVELIAEYPDLRGFNVTIPYKEQIIPYLTSIDPTAQKIGAVNTVKVLHDGYDFKLIGYNTDVIGFSRSLSPLVGDSRHALVLGTGGASKAVSQGLIDMGITPTLVSRSPGEGRISYDRLTPEIISQNTIIVNTTPLGMYPKVDGYPPIPYEYISPRHVCFDLVYNPGMTRFMALAAERGAAVKCGLEMLHLQALAAWDIWNS